jgi:hypothetical protein
MFPRLPCNHKTYSHWRDGEFFNNTTLYFTVRNSAPDFNDLFFGELAIVDCLTHWNNTMKYFVVGVALWGVPSQIFESIVSMVTIIVATLKTFWAFTNKRFQHQSVNILIKTLFVAPQFDLDVPTGQSFEPNKNPVPFTVGLGKRSDSSPTRNQVVWKTWYGLPNLLLGCVFGGILGISHGLCSLLARLSVRASGLFTQFIRSFYFMGHLPENQWEKVGT